MRTPSKTVSIEESTRAQRSCAFIKSDERMTGAGPLKVIPWNRLGESSGPLLRKNLWKWSISVLPLCAPREQRTDGFYKYSLLFSLNAVGLGIRGYSGLFIYPPHSRNNGMEAPCIHYNNKCRSLKACLGSSTRYHSPTRHVKRFQFHLERRRGR